MLNAYRLLLDMMTPGERRRFWLLVAITFLLSALEAASVLSILPFLRLLADPGLIETNRVLSWLYQAGGFESEQSFLIAAGVLVFTITVTGLGLKMVAIWVTTRFALMRSYSFSARLLSKYLHQPYEWFLTRHSATLGNAVLSEVDQVVHNALLPAMQMIPEAFLVVLLVGLMCFLEPEIALGGAVLLGGAYGLIYLGVRRLILRIGVQRLEANRDRFHVVQEATGGVRELKIMYLEAAFLNRFRTAALRMARAQTIGQVIAGLPRQAIEAMAFGGMILLVLILLVRGDGSVQSIIPILGLIAVVGMRLIPVLQLIYRRSANIRMADATLRKIHDDLVNLPVDPDSAASPESSGDALPLADLLELTELRYAYPESDRPALNGLSLSIPANATIGIVGGTGAGKTTLIDLILGLIAPTAGEIRVDGTPITTGTRHAWQRTLGYVPQTIFLSDGTVAENIAFGLTPGDIDMAAVERAARTAELHDFVTTELPDGYQSLVGERGTRLSGGQRQRIGIARALYRDPSTLIFDEATSALDTLTEAAVMHAIDGLAGKKTIIMIAHRLSTVRDCDRIFLLQGGQLAAAGTFDELVAGNEKFRQMAAGLAPVTPSRS